MSWAVPTIQPAAVKTGVALVWHFSNSTDWACSQRIEKTVGCPDSVAVNIAALGRRHFSAENLNPRDDDRMRTLIIASSGAFFFFFTGYRFLRKLTPNTYFLSHLYGLTHNLSVISCMSMSGFSSNALFFRRRNFQAANVQSDQKQWSQIGLFSRPFYSHFSWPMTLNKQLPQTMVWACLPVQLSNTSVQPVWRVFVKQLSTIPLNSFKQGKSWWRPCIEIRHVKTMWILGT